MGRNAQILLLVLCAASAGCASKRWVNGRLEEMTRQFDGKLQATEANLNKSIAALEAKISENQRELAAKLDKLSQDMRDFQQAIKSQIESQTREIKLLEARFARGAEVTRSMLEKEKQLLQQRLEHLDAVLKEMP